MSQFEVIEMTIQHATINGITMWRVYDYYGKIRGAFESEIDAVIFKNSYKMHRALECAKQGLLNKLPGMAMNQINYCLNEVNSNLAKRFEQVAAETETKNQNKTI